MIYRVLGRFFFSAGLGFVFFSGAPGTSILFGFCGLLIASAVFVWMDRMNGEPIRRVHKVILWVVFLDAVSAAPLLLVPLDGGLGTKLALISPIIVMIGQLAILFALHLVRSVWR